MDELEILAVDKGIYRCCVNDFPLTVRPGELVVVKPGDLHSDSYGRGLRLFGLHFRLQAAGETAPEIFKPGIDPAAQKIRVDKKVFWPLFARIREISESNARFSAQVQDTLVHEFFWRLLAALPAESISPSLADLSEDYRFGAALHRLFQQHIHRALSIAEMAKHMNMSESSLAHRCKTVLRTSPLRLFMRSKIERAKSLLKMTSLPIKEISASLGFENPLYFSKVFRHHTGNPPSGSR
jgi:AraC-like DNA-binding protein